MSIHAITRLIDGETTEFDTEEEAPSSAIFDLLNYNGNIIAWSDIVSIEGASEALVDGNLDLAGEYLTELDFWLEPQDPPTRNADHLVDVTVAQIMANGDLTEAVLSNLIHVAMNMALLRSWSTKDAVSTAESLVDVLGPHLPHDLTPNELVSVAAEYDISPLDIDLRLGG